MILMAMAATSLCAISMVSQAVEPAVIQKEIIIKSSEDYADTQWAKLNIPIGTKLLINTVKDGSKLYKLEFAGGVTIEELENGSTLSVDMSKGGAVLCAWDIYAHIKNTLDICHPEEKELRRNIDLIVHKVNNFIVANSLEPITQTELEKIISEKGNDTSIQCQSEITERILFYKSEMTKLQALVDESLATPRPPVLNPCL